MSGAWPRDERSSFCGVIFVVNFNRKTFWFGLLILAELEIIWLYIAPVLTYSSIGFPLDDSWIYAVFARHFAFSGEIAFNLGHPSVGFTSSLWFLLLSLGNLFLLPVVGWSLLLGCISQITLAVVTGLLVSRFLLSVGSRHFQSGGGEARRAIGTVETAGTVVRGEISRRSGSMTDNLDPGEQTVGEVFNLDRGERTVGEVFRRSGRMTDNLDSEAGQSGLKTPPTGDWQSGTASPSLDGKTPPTGTARLLSFFASLLVLFCGPLIWYSLSGMETTCFMAIGLLAIFFLSKERYRWAGIALGFLLITRIEGIALWGIAIVYAGVIKRWTRERRTIGTVETAGTAETTIKLLPLFIIPSIFLLLELLKNLYLTGALLPTTFAGRKWLSVPAGGRGPVAYLKLWGYGFKLTLLPQFLQENPLLIFFWIGAGILAVLSIRLLLKEAAGNKRRISGLILFFLWVIGHNLVYMVMLPSPSQAGRYQALNFLLFWIVLYLPAAAGLARLTGDVPGRKNIFSGLALSVLLCAILLLDLGSTLKWKEIYLSTVRHINDVHLKVAERIKNELPSGSRVAAFDIGALKYFSPETEIIDLGGLVDREFAGYLREGKVVDYMKDRGTEYLAMVELQNSPGWIFENLHIRDDPRLELKPLFGMMQRPEIYRIHYREAAITFPKMVVYEIEWSK